MYGSQAARETNDFIVDTTGRAKQSVLVNYIAPEHGWRRLLQCGTLEQWQTDVAAAGTVEPIVAFGISASLAAPLLPISSIDTCFVHFYGNVLDDRIDILDVVASVWGVPHRERPASIDVTIFLIHSRNGVPLVLDDLDFAMFGRGPRVARMLVRSAGLARERCTADWWMRPTPRPMMITTGLKRFAEYLGDEIARTAPLCIDVSMAAATDALDRVRVPALENTGHVGPLFRAALLQRDGWNRAQAAVERARSSLGQVGPRGARAACATVAAAGELATELGLVPWRAGTATAAAARVLAAWREARRRTPETGARRKLATRS